MPIKDEEKRKEYRKQYYLQNKEVCKERTRKRNKDKAEENREWHRQYHIRKPYARLLGSAKARAKLMGWEFDLTKDDLVFPEFCPLLNCKLTYTGGKQNTNASIDRIDSSIGYVKGNVQIISYLANLMKSRATEEQLIMFATNILKQHELTI